MKEYKPLKRSSNGTRKLKIYKYIKKKVLERDNYKCVKCGLKAEVTHHIIPVWEDRTKINDINNIQCLCNSCHYKIHGYKSSIGNKDSISFIRRPAP